MLLPLIDGQFTLPSVPCPHCESPINALSKKCRNCHEPVGAEDMIEALQEERDRIAGERWDRGLTAFGFGSAVVILQFLAGVLISRSQGIHPLVGLLLVLLLVGTTMACLGFGARSKGHSVWFGLIGILGCTGIPGLLIGLLILLALPSHLRTTLTQLDTLLDLMNGGQGHQLSPLSRVPCPGCSTPVNAALRKCPACGEPLTEEFTSRLLSEEEQRLLARGEKASFWAFVFGIPGILIRELISLYLVVCLIYLALHPGIDWTMAAIVQASGTVLGTCLTCLSYGVAARGKGLSWVWGLLGFFGLLGLPLVLGLPDSAWDKAVRLDTVLSYRSRKPGQARDPRG